MYEKYIKPYIVYPFIIVALVWAGYMYGSYRAAENINNNGDKDKAIIGRLDKIEGDQRNLTTQLERFAKENTILIGRIKAAETRAERIEGIAREALDSIRASDPLIEEARELAERSERALRDILEGK